MSKQPYSETHPHPSHIELPTDTPTPVDDDLPLVSPGPSGARPAPSRSILKNPLRRPSQVAEGDVLSPQTDEERALGEQWVYVLSRWLDEACGLIGSLTWDEANIAETEVQKDSLMCVTVYHLMTTDAHVHVGRSTSQRLPMYDTMRRGISS